MLKSPSCISTGGLKKQGSPRGEKEPESRIFGVQENLTNLALVQIKLIYKDNSLILTSVKASSFCIKSHLM